MDILVGNAADADTQGTGWFIGFSPWTRTGGSELLHVPQGEALSGLCVKWFDHADGDDSGDGKPVSEGRTVSMLVNDGAQFMIEFSARPAFDGTDVRTVILQRPGDFAAWGDGVFHRWRCLRRSTVLTIRWNP